MKTFIIKSTVSIFTILLFVLASCEKNSTGTNEELFAPMLLTSADGVSTIDEDKMIRALGTTSDPTNDEIKLLISIRDEEKLARDVYSAFAEKMMHPVFKRISAAEHTHLSGVNYLLKYYNWADTVISAPGVFANTEVQDLYNDLINKGASSVEEALKTGALIEEMDIMSLRESKEQTMNQNILMVFNNLERGSRNHLRAFNRQLKIRGISYVPAHLSQNEFLTIVNSPFEAGNRYRMNPGGTCIRGN